MESRHQNQLAFQNHWAKHYGGSILNIGCKEDPANIYDCSDDVINMDVLDHDSYSKQTLKNVRGFMNQDFLEWETDKKFDTVVLGEVLEHCDEQRFNEFIEKVGNVLKDDGHFIITCPQDNRPPEVQHDASGLFEIRPGVTTWHQNFVTKSSLSLGLSKAGFYMAHYETKMWLPEENIFWHFVVAERV